ncbi:MAG: ABC transporter permease [Acidobacteriota bacterium]
MLWDLRYSVRMLLKRPGFTIVAVLTMALGIGANTALFSVIDGVLLEPPPYPQPNRVMVIDETNIEAGLPRFAASPANYADFRDENQTFAALGAMGGAGLTLTGEGVAERLTGARVSGPYFAALGVKPMLGRVIQPIDDEVGAPPVVVLNHGFWQRRFGGDESVLGRVLRLNGVPREVIGVMPPGIQPQRDAWIPIAIDYRAENRGAHYLGMIGRLRDGVSVEQASADLAQIAAELEVAYPDTNTGWSTRVQPLPERVVEGVAPALWILFAAVGLVLLIACVNIANLLLARVSLRGREMALRAALGAGRDRLLRQLLTESVLLAVLGGVLGMVLAWLATPWLVDLAGGDLPRSTEVAVDGRVLGFALLLSMLTGVIFGLVPALRASRIDLRGVLEDGGRGQSGGIGRLRGGLVLAEVALALVLLVGAGLMMRSLAGLLDVDPGFQAEDVLTARIDLPETTYGDDESRFAFYRQLWERLEAIPGVEHASTGTSLPLTGRNNIFAFYVEGTPRSEPGLEPSSITRFVGPDYFDVMGVPLLEGRAFSTDDDSDAVLALIINKKAADTYWRDDPTFSRRLTFENPDDPEAVWFNVVGVVGDVRHDELATAPEPTMYIPMLQMAQRSPNIVLRTSLGDPALLEGPLRATIAELDVDMPVFNVEPMEALVAGSLARSRFNATLLGIFAGLAVVLAAIGIYGLISYSVNEQRREIGIRRALGADRRRILELVIKQGMKPVLLGVGVGVVLALAGAQILAGLVYGIPPRDPGTLALVAVLLAVVGLLACLAPALRAIRIDPMRALREE